MKQISIFTLLLIFFISCNKNPINNTEDKVGISKVTFFPTLTLKGSNPIVLTKGSTFTDPGITAKEGANDITYTTVGSVDVNTPGVYLLTYTAVNKDGFPASITRTVVIYQTDATASANDFSGNYARTSNGSIATWTKIAPGVYSVFNPGGAPGTNLTAIVFNQTGFEIHIPRQVTNDGNVTESSNETYSNLTPPQYSWKIINPTYGTALRTFIKQ